LRKPCLRQAGVTDPTLAHHGPEFGRQKP